MDVIDRDASGVDHVSGLTHETLYKSDPVWSALRGEFAKLNAALADLQAKHNALATDTSHAGDASTAALPSF